MNLLEDMTDDEKNRIDKVFMGTPEDRHAAYFSIFEEEKKHTLSSLKKIVDMHEEKEMKNFSEFAEEVRDALRDLTYSVNKTSNFIELHRETMEEAKRIIEGANFLKKALGWIAGIVASILVIKEIMK